MYEKEDVYLDEHMRNNILTVENQQLYKDLAESHVSKARLRSILYIIGIIVLYGLYRAFIVDGTSLKTCSLYWLIDAVYWVVTTIVVNLINHKLFIEGLLSLFSKKYKQKMIAAFLQDYTSKQ